MGKRLRQRTLERASCILAGLVAEGETLVYDIYHIYRGYYDVIDKF